LEAINASKTELETEDERENAIRTGTKWIEKAFHANEKRSAAAANALCELFIRKGDHKTVRKGIPL